MREWAHNFREQFLLRGKGKLGFLVKPLRYIVAAFLICLIIECFCFNYTAIQTANLVPDSVSVTGATKGRFLLRNVNRDDIKTISLSFSATPKPDEIVQVTHVNVFLTDDTHRYRMEHANGAYVYPDSETFGTVVMQLSPSGTMHDIMCTWEGDNVFLTAVSFNAPVPFKFHVTRVLLLFLLASSVILIHSFKLWKIKFDFESTSHRLCYVFTILLGLLLPIYFFAQMTPEDKSEFYYTVNVSYPFTVSAEELHPLPHVLAFDAMMNGSPYLRVPEDERLAKLDNPYDRSLRESTEDTEDFLWWDYAYYNGHIYMYFGMAPILVFYLPFYNMTGYLPSYNESGFFFAFLTVLAGFLCIWELAKRYAKETGLLTLCMGAYTAVIGSGILMLQSMADRYHLSIACEQAFWFLALWMAIRARNSEEVERRVCLAFSALFTGLMIASRPTGGIILAAWLSVLFVPILFEKDTDRRDKILDMVSFLVPVVFCAALIMAYNYVRFDSVFEFGSKYHLTVEDIRENKIMLRHLPQALFHFIFEPLYIHSDFPWFRTVYIESNYGFVNHTGNFMAAESAMGVLAIPIVWGNLLFSRNAGGEGHVKEWKWLFLTSLAAVAVTMLFEFDYAGIELRYAGDFLPSLCLTALLCLLNWTRPRALVDSENLHRYRIYAIICLITLMVSFSLGFSNHRNFIRLYAPDKYLRIVETLSLP